MDMGFLCSIIMFLKVGSGIDEGKLQELGVDQRQEEGAGDRRRKGWGLELHRLCSLVMGWGRELLHMYVL